MRRMSVARPYAEQVLTLDELIGLQAAVDTVFVHHAVAEYAVRLVMATREPERVGVPGGASATSRTASSPRGSLGPRAGRQGARGAARPRLRAARRRRRPRRRRARPPAGADLRGARRRGLRRAASSSGCSRSSTHRTSRRRRTAARPAGCAREPRPPSRLPRWRAPPRSARLRLQVGRRLDGLLQGDHLGHLPGPGTEAAEARPYGPGDDVRRIDWAVTARSTEPHVRHDGRRAGARDDAASSTCRRRCRSAPPAPRSATSPSPWPRRSSTSRSGPGDRVGAGRAAGTGLRPLPPRGGRGGLAGDAARPARPPRAPTAPGPGLAEALRVAVAAGPAGAA